MMTTLPICETLLLDQKGGRLYVTFNRPERRNAMNNQMSAELNALIDHLAGDRSIRVVVFRGADHNFCAGGDIKERRQETKKITAGSDPVYERNIRSGTMFKNISHLPQTTVAVVEGAAMGGGFGFACLMDITLVEANARLGMPETTLGIAPAQIAVHVVRRIGLTKARHLALTGSRINGERAFELGIAQYLFQGSEEGEALLKDVLQQIEGCGPEACAATKDIMRAVGQLSEDEVIAFAAKRFAVMNKGAEGREGQLAFVEKRPPKWPIPEA